MYGKGKNTYSGRDKQKKTSSSGIVGDYGVEEWRDNGEFCGWLPKGNIPLFHSLNQSSFFQTCRFGNNFLVCATSLLDLESM